MTPTELVKYAHKRGLSAISITDHDAIDGINEAVDAGEEVGVAIVPGIELSVKHCDLTLHILGYYFNHEQNDFLQALRRLQDGRLERNQEILKILSRLGVNIHPDELAEVSGQGQTGRPHIAQLLIRKGAVRTMDEAFDKYLGQRGAAYVPRFVFPAGDAIALIHNAGGLAVLAHPQQLEKTGENFPKVIESLCHQGLDGIEVYYPTHSRQFRKMLLRFVKKHDLIITGGSDYHGNIRPGSTLAGGKKCSVPANLLQEMAKRRHDRLSNNNENLTI